MITRKQIKRFWSDLPVGPKLAIGILVVWTLSAAIDPFSKILLGYDFAGLSLSETLLPPLSDGAHGIHWLGTDDLGRDLLAGMIHGGRVALVISFTSVLLSLLLGLTFGLLVGYYGDSNWKKNIPQQISIILCVAFTAYYTVDMLNDGPDIYNILPMILILVIGKLLDYVLSITGLRQYGVPLDMFVLRIFELRESLPSLFIILALAAIMASQSIFSVAIIISILFWITFARHARAETIQIKEEDYIMSAKSSGVSDMRLLFYHILPNALPAIMVIIAFTFSSVILLEATLSFLGIGLPVEEVSWGKILDGARRSYKSWWLAIFPGLAIFLVLYAFNTLGDYFAQYQRR